MLPFPKVQECDARKAKFLFAVGVKMVSKNDKALKKVLVTGAAGMLGSSVAKYMEKSNEFKTFGTGRTSVEASSNYYVANLLDSDAVHELLDDLQPDVIVHCAANVNLNQCETDKEAADKIHVEATATLASYKPGICKLIYISTDSVFEGVKGDYTEEDATMPLNYYAASKLKGEEKAFALNKNTAIVRTNIYGYKKNGASNSLFEWLYKNLSNKNTVTGFTDTWFNPLYTIQLAEVIFGIAKTNITGIINAGCKEYISKYDFAKLVADVFGFDGELTRKGSIDAMPSELKRPKNTTLNTALLTGILGRCYYINDGIKMLKNDFLTAHK
jgi:dTDP-4-dehydrorhamnose reductase